VWGAEAGEGEEPWKLVGACRSTVVCRMVARELGVAPLAPPSVKMSILCVAFSLAYDILKKTLMAVTLNLLFLIKIKLHM
jgi:hypothetical protein